MKGKEEWEMTMRALEEMQAKGNRRAHIIPLYEDGKQHLGVLEWWVVQWG